ncbi:MAG: type II toxin-antitoxin system VapC family toxin [Gammaproteobacteria bacterium]|nr:type II toxin-antitoxin system VapC family toxin [Gammaproteobacteria bacterium]
MIRQLFMERKVSRMKPESRLVVVNLVSDLESDWFSSQLACLADGPNAPDVVTALKSMIGRLISVATLIEGALRVHRVLRELGAYYPCTIYIAESLM